MIRISKVFKKIMIEFQKKQSKNPFMIELETFIYKNFYHNFAKNLKFLRSKWPYPVYTGHFFSCRSKSVQNVRVRSHLATLRHRAVSSYGPRSSRTLAKGLNSSQGRTQEYKTYRPISVRTFPTPRAFAGRFMQKPERNWSIGLACSITIRPIQAKAWMELFYTTSVHVSKLVYL